MSYDVLSIANKILAIPDPEAGDELISNLKLQKLLYYVQGFNLAAFGEPLFKEDVEAWQYGPVVPCVYEKFSSYGGGGIPSEGIPVVLSEREENLFNKVYTVYSRFSAITLMNMTHKEKPWQSVDTGRGNVISKDELGRYFKTRLN